MFVSKISICKQKKKKKGPSKKAFCGNKYKAWLDGYFKASKILKIGILILRKSIHVYMSSEYYYLFLNISIIKIEAICPRMNTTLVIIHLTSFLHTDKFGRFNLRQEENYSRYQEI